MERTAHPWRDAFVVLLIVAAAIGVSLWLRRDILVNHDVNWFVVAAERMLQGGSFTRDIFEVNVPLATAIYIPSLLVAWTFSISLPTGILAWTYTCLAASVYLTWRVLAPAPGSSAWWALAWIACLLAIFPAYEFAEREHLAVLLCLPFVALCSNPRKDIGRGLRIVVVVLAAIGAFIKPHYALLPFMLLLARVPEVGLRRALLGTDCLVLVSVGLANAATVALLFPEWLESAVWTVDLYGYYRGDDPARFLQADSALVSMATSALLVLTMVGRPDLWRMAVPFVIAAAYAWIMFVLQGKGWRYHLLPAGLFSAAGLAAIWPHLGQPPARARSALLLFAVFLAAGAGLLAHAVDMNRRAPRLSHLRPSGIGEALSITRPGDSIYAFSTSAIPYFPAVIHLELEWASRYSALWPLSSLGKPDALLDAEGIALKRKYTPAFIASVVDDFRRRKPDVALVDLRPGQFGVPDHFDFLGFFMQSPEFAREWSHYHMIGQSAEVAIYVRAVGE